ncbi:MAG: trypsin-like peptidase domain-containing protein [Pyrinomonadaceae bacterium]|nr:trypsin-like peptidase domain-containing protein [Pyrinomonadaceae bacterium]
MIKPNDELAANIERKLFRKLIFSISIIAIICLTIGIGVGVLVSERHAKASEPIDARMPEAISASFAEVARRVEPAVVNIDTKGKVPEVTLKGDKSDNAPSDDILEYFKRQNRKPSYSVGSGFIVDKSGYILTNYHVVDDAAKITVRLQNSEEYPARIIGTDEETDLAVLKIDAGKDLPSVKLGDSGSAQIGDWVLAIGSPFGLAQTVTAGIVSQTNRETPYASVFQKFIQTDAAINRGNSGGPLVNMNGEVIGVNSQIATSTGDYNGIGFALPSNEAGYVYQQILANGKVRRGFLGVNLETIKPEYGKVYDLPDLKGAIITEIRDKDSRAAKAGLSVNDVIVEFDGKTIESSPDLIAKVAATEPEREVKITFYREVNSKLEKQTVSIKLGERPITNRVSENADTPKKLNIYNSNNATFKPFGLTLEELTPATAKTNNLEGQKGLLIKEIDDASFIVDVKNTNGRGVITEGDVIQRINKTTVSDVKTFNEIASKMKVGDAVVLHLAYYNRFSRSIQQRIVSFTVQ